jgi:ribonuclease R
VLQGRLGDEMDGTISSVGAQGVYVELDEVYAEGLLPVTALPSDRYAFDAMRLSLVGERTSRVYRAGQRLRVLVARVDRIAQRTELALVGCEGGGVSARPRGVGEYASSGARRRADTRSKPRRGGPDGRPRGRR